MNITSNAKSVSPFYFSQFAASLLYKQLHLQSGEQSKLALPHLQVEQSPLQEHLISSLHALETSGIVDQTGTHDPSSLFLGSSFQLLHVDCQKFQKLEILTVILYDKSSPVSSINQARKELFCHANRQMEKRPPTQDALLQHIRRAVYQAGEEEFRLS